MSHAQRWNSLEVVKGTFGPDDTVNLIAEIKFEQPIPIRVKRNHSFVLLLNECRDMHTYVACAKWLELYDRKVCFTFARGALLATFTLCM